MPHYHITDSYLIQQDRTIGSILVEVLDAASTADLCKCGHELAIHISIMYNPMYRGSDINVGCNACTCDRFVLLYNESIDPSYDYEEQENEIMARLTSELQDAGTSTTIPNGIYNAHVALVMDEDRNDVSKPLKSQAGAPMVQLNWEVDEGDYAGKLVKFDTIMLGGLSREGKPISLSNLCNFLHRTGVPWTCEDCHNPEIGRKFYIAEGSEDDKARGLKKGNFYCPDCKTAGTNSPRITYETKTFMGARCGIGVGSKPGTDGREFNIVKGYTDIK